MTEAHTERAHAKLSPSASGRWSECPGSVAMEMQVGERPSSPAANEGTAAHELAAHCLDTGLDVARHLGRKIDIRSDTIFTDAKPDENHIWEVTAEMVQCVTDYVKLVRKLGTPPSEMVIEKKVRAKQIDDDCWGTADAVIYQPGEKHLHVVDLKYGRGVVVEAVDNTQGGIYASGARSTLYHNRQIDQITVHIFQPRAPHSDGPHRTFTFDLRHLTGVIEHHLNVAAGTVRKALADHQAIDNGISMDRWVDRYLKTGSHCRFCAASAVCPAQAKQALAIAQSEFDVVDSGFEDPTKMTPQRLGMVLTKAREIQHWIKAVEEHANAEAHAGRMPEGFKLVAGRAGARQWRDEEQVLGLLPMFIGGDTSDLTETRLLSPAQLEKKIPAEAKKAISAFIKQNTGASQLVPVSDKRPPIRADAATEFEPTLQV